jgi:hypothetical protein
MFEITTVQASESQMYGTDAPLLPRTKELATVEQLEKVENFINDMVKRINELQEIVEPLAAQVDALMKQQDSATSRPKTTSAKSKTSRSLKTETDHRQPAVKRQKVTDTTRTKSKRMTFAQILKESCVGSAEEQKICQVLATSMASIAQNKMVGEDLASCLFLALLVRFGWRNLCSTSFRSMRKIVRTRIIAESPWADFDTSAQALVAQFIGRPPNILECFPTFSDHNLPSHVGTSSSFPEALHHLVCVFKAMDQPLQHHHFRVLMQGAISHERVLQKIATVMLSNVTDNPRQMLSPGIFQGGRIGDALLAALRSDRRNVNGLSIAFDALFKLVCPSLRQAAMFSWDALFDARPDKLSEFTYVVNATLFSAQSQNQTKLVATLMAVQKSLAMLQTNPDELNIG